MGMRDIKRRKNFMQVAEAISDMATCDRAHVGCVLVQGKRIIATGYNGAPSGMFHCDEIGHDLEDGHCVRTIHAEINAVLQCAEFGVSTRGAEAYCTVHPCVRCASALYSAGVSTIYFKNDYKTMSRADEDRIKALKDAGLNIFRVETK